MVAQRVNLKYDRNKLSICQVLNGLNTHLTPFNGGPFICDLLRSIHICMNVGCPWPLRIFYITLSSGETDSIRELLQCKVVNSDISATRILLWPLLSQKGGFHHETKCIRITSIALIKLVD